MKPERRTAHRLVLALILSLANLDAAWADEVLLSELMASNRATLVDEDGDSPDWVELFNSESVPVDLEGWSLTDDPEEPFKWRFPSVEIGARNYLVVFCSGKDRAAPEAPLHTNFSLSAAGEFLGLLRADGTGASHFFPAFPTLLPDVSFGFSQSSTQTPLLVAGASGRAFIPIDGALGLGWTEPAFDDGSWIPGATAFGFDQKSLPTYLELIQTDIGESMRNLNASAYLRLPFDVQDPTAIDFLDLDMKYEDGFIAYLNGVEVARSQAPDMTEWNSESTSRRDVLDAVEPQGFELTRFRDLVVRGTNLLAVHGLNTSAGNNDFFVLPELSSTTLGELEMDQPQFFAKPTPGRPNGEGAEGIAEPPEFSLRSGAHFESAEVELFVRDSDAEIRFTHDGSLPTEESELYAGPIAMDASTQIKARAFQPGHLPSAPVAESFLIFADELIDFTSDLPIVVVDTFGVFLPRTEAAQDFRPAHIQVFDLGPGGRSALDGGVVDFSGRGAVKVRGSSSSRRPKASLAVELRDADDGDSDFELLGMPADSDWNLYGPFDDDPSLIRNAFAYALSNRIGRYAVRSRFVELFFNEGGGVLSGPVPTGLDYFGVYVLMEKIKRGESRVDVERLSRSDNREPEITGGYVLKIDRPDPGEIGFIARGQPFRYVDPKERDITPVQAEWIKSYMEAFLTILDGPDFDDPEMGYERFIDVGTFIDHHLLNEFPKNVDAFGNSTYMRKRRNGKLEMGPIWDFNVSMWDDPRGWSIYRLGLWWDRLFQDRDFEDRYIRRWQELRRAPLSLVSINAVIDTMTAELAEAKARNFQRWTGVALGGWESEIDRLRGWLAERVEWMDCALRRRPRFNTGGGRVSPPFELTITNPEDVGEILFTVNGPDPMQENGEPAPEARSYTGSLTITENTRVRARLRIEDCLALGSGWSGLVEVILVVSPFSIAPTEIMYSPQPGNEYEYVELFNFGDETAHLDGAFFSAGVDFSFGEGATIEPGEYVVVVRNLEVFSSLYDTSTLKIAGEFSGVLRDRGEDIALAGPVSEPIFTASYSNEWYPETDGGGHSLVLVDPTSPPETWDEEASWAPSLEVNGSPGRADGGNLGGGQIPGDANQDTRFNIADAVFVLFYVFRGNVGDLPCADGSSTARANLRLLDLNDDASLNAADAIHGLNYLFRRGPAPIEGARCAGISGCPELCSP